MSSIFTSYVRELGDTRGKALKVSISNMLEICDLPKSARMLLLQLLGSVGHELKLESFYITVDIKKFGFTSRSKYYSARKVLVDKGYIHCFDKQIIINPCKVNYLSRKQRDYLNEVLGIKSKPDKIFGIGV